MNKEKLLEELSIKINTGEISREEVIAHFGLVSASQAVSAPENTKASSAFSITKMLYILGAAIVVIGVVIFISQIWGDIGSFGRIVITLGFGLLTAATGSMLLKSRPDENIGAVFHFIGGMLIPSGAMVALYELAPNFDYYDWPLAVVYGGIFAFYLLLNHAHKNSVLTFFAIVNGTAFAYLLLEAALADQTYGMQRNIEEYLTMAIGLSYLFLAYAFRGGWNKKLISALYLFGTTGFLGMAFLKVIDDEHLLWQMFYFAFVTGGLALSVYLKSRIVLVVSTIFLICHVTYITWEHFSNSLNWPVLLIFLGFVFIGLGFVSVNINKKYIANTN